MRHIFLLINIIIVSQIREVSVLDRIHFVKISHLEAKYQNLLFKKDLFKKDSVFIVDKNNNYFFMENPSIKIEPANFENFSIVDDSIHKKQILEQSKSITKDWYWHQVMDNELYHFRKENLFSNIFYNKINSFLKEETKNNLSLDLIKDGDVFFSNNHYFIQISKLSKKSFYIKSDLTSNSIIYEEHLPLTRVKKLQDDIYFKISNLTFKKLNLSKKEIQKIVKEQTTSNKTYQNWALDLRSSLNVELKQPKRKIKIAMLDSGFSPKMNIYQNFKNNTQTLIDHGSHVGGLILATNPNVELISYNVYSENDQEIIDKTMKALKDAILKKVDIINISMAGQYFSDSELSLLKKAEKQGILLIVAAGNNSIELSNESCIMFPACYKPFLKNMIVVGNITSENLIHYSSNYGNMVDVFFYGTKIKSLGEQNEFELKTGTSMSTPLISGLLSLELEQSRDNLKTLNEFKNKFSSIRSKNKEIKIWNVGQTNMRQLSGN